MKLKEKSGGSPPLENLASKFVSLIKTSQMLCSSCAQLIPLTHSYIALIAAIPTPPVRYLPRILTEITCSVHALEEVIGLVTFLAAPLVQYKFQS